MRVVLAPMLGVTSIVACAPATKQQLTPPPSYARPAAPKHSFSASRAKLIVVDARREPVQADSQPAADSESGADDDDLSELATKELATLLEERLSEALAAGDRELVFRVEVVEARAIDAAEATVRATIDVSVEAGGQKLATTRGVSTLVGYVGGMTLATQQRIEGAVADAFERSVLREAFVQAINATLVSSDQATLPVSVPPATQTWSIDSHQGSSDVHLLSAAFDGGETYSFGLRYLHDHFDDGTWAGYGAEARLITADFDRIDALAGLGIVRAGIGFEQAYSIELGFGPGGRERVRGIGVAGLYYSLYYVDLGPRASRAIRSVARSGVGRLDAKPGRFFRLSANLLSSPFRVMLRRCPTTTPS